MKTETKALEARQPQVAEQLALLEEEIDLIELLLAELQGRLESVLRPSIIETSGEAADKEKDLVSLADQIRDKRKKLQDGPIARLRYINEALEL